MKKYLLAALVVLSASTFAANVTVFGGLDMNGKLREDVSSSLFEKESYSDDADKIGYTIGVEAHKQVAKFSKANIELGVGAKYESSFIFEDVDGKTLATTVPVYGSAKINFPVTKKVNLYLQGTAGYVFASKGDLIDDLDERYSGFTTELNGGLYTGIGAGVEAGKYNVGLTYSVSNYEYEVSDSTDYIKREYEYKKLALTVGYKFGI